MVRVQMEKTGLYAFVRIKEKDKESLTFEILFSKPIIKSILDSLASKTFTSDICTLLVTSEYHFIVRFKETEHEKCCIILDKFLKELDIELSTASAVLKPLEEKTAR